MCRHNVPGELYIVTKYEFDEQRPTPGGGKDAPMFTPDQAAPPLVDICMMLVRGFMPPPPSFIVAMKTLPSVGLTVT